MCKSLGSKIYRNILIEKAWFFIRTTISVVLTVVCVLTASLE